MESVYQQSLSTTSTSGFPPLVQVLEDCLFEVNLDARELYPLYWEGSVLEIRRGLWFRPALSSDKSSSSSASGFVPCDDNLSQQAENGYNKHKPWMTTGSGAGNHVLTSLSSATSLSSTSNSSLVATVDQEPHGKISSDIDAAAAAVFASIALPPDYTIPQSSSSATNSTSSTSELRWALFGPYMNQFIVYTNKSTAFLFSDQLSSKFTRAVYTKLTKGEHLGGVKLVRGWDEVERLKQQQQQQQAADANASKKSTSSSKSATTTPNTSPSRDNGGKDPASLSTPPQDHSSPTAAATDTFEQESLANFLDQGGNNNTSMDSSSTTTSAASNKAEIDLQQPRKINHLVFVIHG